MKIVLLHNEIKIFRAPLFQALSSKYDISFYSLRENKLTVDSLDSVHYGKYFRIPKMQDLEIPVDLWGYLKEQNPDIIISTDLGYAITYVGFAFSKKFNKKFILWNEQWCNINHPRRKLTRILEKYICKNAYSVLAFGIKQAEYVIGLGAAPENVNIVPNAVPDILPSLENDINVPWLKDNTLFKIVCPGRLIKIKGHSIILDAAAKLIDKHNNIRFIFAGSGPELEILKEKVQAKNLNNHVYITNKTYDAKERDILFTYADLIILASIRMRAAEAWGLVVNEAAMFAKKVIVSDATGVANELVVDKYSGRVHINQDPDSLAECIISAYENDIAWEQYSKALKQRVTEYYSMSVLIKRFEKIFDGLI